ncbi:hypothetical protein FRB95_000904 [Tulasnella sp. JGI-2019a]|nr:hypothetical protein FRB93_010413 [Tulasnella sp. JGI-2019a]KAG9032889.1 hypothetical protein FRB95_000904 [Tulasnella sp. JGI-2019a]
MKYNDSLPLQSHRCNGIGAFGYSNLQDPSKGKSKEVILVPITPLYGSPSKLSTGESGIPNPKSIDFDSSASYHQHKYNVLTGPLFPLLPSFSQAPFTQGVLKMEDTPTNPSTISMVVGLGPMPIIKPNVARKSTSPLMNGAD